MKYGALRHSLCASLALTFVAGTVAAAGSEGSTNAAGAEALDEETRGLMKQGDFARACPKFKQSYDLDPKLSKITTEVQSEANEAGLTVKLDGAPVGAATWGVGMPVDPGTQRAAASAPNKSPLEQRIELESSSTTLELPKLADATATTAGSRAVDTDTEKKPVSDDGDAGAGKGRRTAAFVIGGVGIVALGVGSYFGLRAFSKWGERKDNCVGGCDSAAKSAGDDAKSAATVADIGIGLGVVAIGVGTYLLLSAKDPKDVYASRPPSAQQARALQFLPTLGSTGGGFLLRGAY